MSPEISVLRALLRLARRRTPATTSELFARVDLEHDELARVLERLVRADLVLRTDTGVRLSLGGLAVAAASVPPVGRRRAKAPAVETPAARRVAPAAPRAVVVPLARRRPAA